MKPVSTHGASLASLDLTHVLYDANSDTALAFALVTLSPILLMASYAALAAVTRDLLIVNMWFGQFACEGFNWLLKRLIKAERPYESHGNGYGFPSSHSQYMGYFASFLLLHLWSRHRFSSSFSSPIYILQHLFVSSILVSWAAVVCLSRYHLSYHTASQIIWGLSIGIVFGLSYYTLTELLPFYFRFPLEVRGQHQTSPSLPALIYYPSRVRTWILASSLATWIQLKDGWATWSDGGHEAQWLSWRKEWESTVLSSGATDKRE